METDNGVQYNLREMEDLIQAKTDFMSERRSELIKLVPTYKEVPVFKKKKRPIRIRRPLFQAARPKAKKTEKEKEKEEKAKEAKGKAKAKGKADGGDKGGAKK